MGIVETLTGSWRALVAEFTGSTFLLFAGTTSKAVGDIGLRFGMTLAILAVAIGPVSGAHYNPAVSMAALICSRIEWLVCILYVLVQLAGSILGAGIAQAVSGTLVTLPMAAGDHLEETFGDDSGGSNHKVLTAIIIEILITLLLVLVFLGATDPQRGEVLKETGGLFVGLALATGHWIGLNFSGASMNPFRSLGSALIKNEWSDIWVYFAGPLAGAALAAILYRFIFSTGKGSSSGEGAA